MRQTLWPSHGTEYYLALHLFSYSSKLFPFDGPAEPNLAFNFVAKTVKTARLLLTIALPVILLQFFRTGFKAAILFDQCLAWNKSLIVITGRSAPTPLTITQHGIPSHSSVAHPPPLWAPGCVKHTFAYLPTGPNMPTLPTTMWCDFFFSGCFGNRANHQGSAQTNPKLRHLTIFTLAVGRQTSLHDPSNEKSGWRMARERTGA